MSDDKNIGQIIGSEVVEDAVGRQYHIDLAPGEVAETIFLVGDPARAKKVSEHFNTVSLSRHNREFISFTGTIHGYDSHDIPVTTISTGIGSDNVEICMIELSRIISENNRAIIIRLGSCGGLQDYTKVGDLVVSTAAIRLENTSDFFVEPCYPAVAHHEVVLALSSACQKLGFQYHIGLTASSSGFYGAQGRKIEKFPLRFPELPDQLRARRVLNFEMESSALFTLAQLWGVRSGTICAVYVNRFTGNFISPEQKIIAEQHCIKAGLEAARFLHWMDKKKGSNRYWALKSPDNSSRK
ncbi:MAG: nucleoside phosphorylase [Candidatus Hodarchaeales archaeon]